MAAIINVKMSDIYPIWEAIRMIIILKKNCIIYFKDQAGGTSNMPHFNTVYYVFRLTLNKIRLTNFYLEMKINMNPYVVENHLNIILYTYYSNNNITMHFCFVLLVVCRHTIFSS